MIKYGIRTSRRGFTIVELLIVIVVIGILAAISLVAYTSIQAKARDGARDSAANGIRKALELHKAENGTYPVPASCINVGCALSNLSSYLVPTYVNAIPDDPAAPTKRIMFVSNATGDGYGLYVQYYETKPACKFLGGNGTTGWWGTSVPTCQ